MKKGDVKSKIKKSRSKKKIYLIIFVIICLLFLVSFFTNFYLYFKYLLGNDVIVNLDPENEDLFLKHGENATVLFDSSVISNPFCNVDCNYFFRDVSSGVMIDSGEFTLKSLQPFSKSYNLSSPLFGTYQGVYRFELECRGVPSFLCYTSEKEYRKTSVIVLNYDLSDKEIKLKESIELEFYNMTRDLNLISSNLLSIENIILDNPNLDFRLKNIVDIKVDLFKFNESIFLFIDEWGEGDYDNLKSKFYDLNSSFELIRNNFTELNSSFFDVLIAYNNLTVDVSSLYGSVSLFNGLNLTNDTTFVLNSFVNDFNGFIFKFGNKSTVFDKRNDFERLISNYKIIYPSIENDSFNNEGLILSNFTLLPFNFSEIKPYLSNLSYGFYLSDVVDTCCFFGKCKDCCDDSCYFDEKLYPIIFIHGHDFSSGISPEYNLNAFSDIQQKLEENYGIYNFGSSLVNVPSNISSLWSRFNVPISIRSSYYYDVIYEGENINVLETKKDSIDSYSIRLKNIIDSVKIKTNRDKVILVTHSMGGLVARRYLQVFGDSDVSMIIMVACPNHGVSGSISKYCSFFGEADECDDLDENSLLIKKLNNQEKPKIEVYNIIGIGCDMNGFNGDGIVTNSSAFLSWANNSYVEGSCNDLSLEYLHTKILSTDKYPQIVDLIGKELNS